MSDQKPPYPLFVSTRYPYYSAVVDPGGEVVLGNNRVARTKPRFAEFRPGPMGGHFELTPAAAKRLKMSVDDLLAAMRGRDSIDKEFLEVTSISQIPGLVKARAEFVRDAEDQEKKSGKSADKAKKDALAAEPEVSEAAPPADKAKKDALAAEPEVSEAAPPAAPKAPAVGKKKVPAAA